MKNNTDFLYELNYTSEHESVITNDNFLNNILIDVNTYYSIPNFSSDMLEIKKQPVLGNYAFYLLSNNSIKFDVETKKKINLINIYLSNCISNKTFCNNNIFLTFVRYILQIPEIPTCKAFSSCSNNIISDSSSIEMRLNSLLNIDCDIQLYKDYLCKNIIDLIISSIFEIFQKGYKIKRCRICNRYFYNKSNNKYCSYSCPQDTSKSCYEYSSSTSSIEKRKNDIIQSKYTSITNRFRNYCDYHEFKEGWDMLGKFSQAYCDMKTSLRQGLINEDRILQYLEEHDIRFKEIVKERKTNGSTRNNKK